MEKSVILRWIVMSFLLLFLFSFIGFLAVSFVTSMFGLNISKNIEESLGVKKYRMYQVDLKSKSSSVGMVKLPRNLDGEYEYYVDGLGHHNLISEFGSTTYQCTGTCFCSDENRRNLAATTSRSVFYLLSAASSAVALNLAKKYFDDTCLNVISESYECSPENVQSEVENCETTPEESEESEYHIYNCEGECSNRKMSYTTYAKNPHFGKCLHLRVRDTKIEVMAIDPKRKGTHASIRAKLEFMKKYLRPHCTKTSEVTFPEDFNIPKFRGKTRSLCKADPLDAFCFRVT